MALVMKVNLSHVSSTSAVGTALENTDKKGKFSWGKWYEKNKKRLSEEKKRRYAEDASYRNAIKSRSRSQHKTVFVPRDEYTISLQQLSEQLGVSIWALREWRKKNYFPEPVHRKGRLWFSPHQAQWVYRLHQFFLTRGVRTKKADREALDSLTQLVYANWQG